MEPSSNCSKCECITRGRRVVHQTQAKQEEYERRQLRGRDLLPDHREEASVLRPEYHPPVYPHHNYRHL